LDSGSRRPCAGPIADIGYEQTEFHHAHFEFQNYLHKQSTDIAMGVDR
jgi:S-adenosylmethionine synthetase